ncbi:hypothetical protein BSIN_1191 [Burkholderia singularis]|uniref:Uncharacterized protein n=1 Tax=Burkholderia singularis TaxID=1503053 RepID=A0A238HDV5_9BURK|nr:hypothetical protein BSIN_1191 [Burkholderia singularis]
MWHGVREFKNRPGWRAVIQPHFGIRNALYVRRTFSGRYSPSTTK